MARTIDRAAHAKRRDAYVDAALRLIQAKGYEALSVQDVIEEVGTSKGAFFHYFDSKAALLAAVVDRMVEEAARTVAPVTADPDLTPLEKLQAIYSGIYRWKREQPELQPEVVAELMTTWYSDENAVVLERMRAATASRLTPLLAGILREGAADGSFSVSSPDGAASVATSLMMGLNDAASRLFLARRAGEVSIETVSCTLVAYFEALERILGLPPSTWPRLDEPTLRFWFG